MPASADVGAIVWKERADPTQKQSSHLHGSRSPPVSRLQGKAQAWVWGSGFRVSGSGLGVQGVGLGVQGSGLWVWGLVRV